MTLLFQEGFQGYGGAYGLAQRWDNVGGSVAVGGGRGGGNACALGSAELMKVIPEGTTTLIVGFAAFVPLGTTFIHFRDLATSNWFASLGFNAVGDVYAQALNDFGSLMFTADPGMRVGLVWRYVEIKFHLDASTGSIEVRLDGTTVHTFAGNTKNGLGDDIRRLAFVGTGAKITDLYIADDQDTGDGVTDFLGDRRMFNIYPNGAVTAAWTPSPAVANWQNVDDRASDDDTTVVTASVVATEDKHDYEPTGLAGTVPVYATVVTSARRDADSGPREVTSFFDDGSGHRQEGGVHQLSDTYYMTDLNVTKHPFTGAPLTAADVDAARAGYRLTA